MKKKSISVDLELHKNGVKAPSLSNVTFHLH